MSPEASIREQLEAREHEYPRAAGGQERCHQGTAAPRGRGSDPPGVPARPRSHHPHEGVPAAEAQDAGVLLPRRGDHYRTRLTHTLEVSQIARTIAKVLRLHEELTEAIALGHDLGHTPFGHAGERVLNTLVPGGSTTTSRACGSSTCSRTTAKG